MHSNNHSHHPNKPQSSGMPRSAMMQGPLPFYHFMIGLEKHGMI